MNNCIGNLIWYFQRLKKMNVAEACYQFNKRIRKKLDLNRVIGSISVENFISKGLIKDLSAGNAENTINYFRNRTNVFFYFDKSNKDYIVSQIKDYGDECLKIFTAAEKLVEGKFDFFGYGQAFVDNNKIAWNRDYIHQVEWPFSSSIRIKVENGPGDIKNVWELSRFYHFYILSLAYLYYKNDSYLQIIDSHINSWIDNNPAGCGPNWISSLEVGIRSIAWIWTLELIGEYLNDQTYIKIIKSLYQHGLFLYNNLTLYAVPNNHLIGELAGLSLIAIYFPEFRKSKQWRETGLKHLEKEFVKQVYDDGFSNEQSVNYHRFVLDFYILLFLITKYNSIDFNIDREKFKKMFNALAQLIDTDGTPALFGDHDEGRGYCLIADHLDYRETVSLGKALFPDVEFGQKVHRYASVLWLTGKQLLLGNSRKASYGDKLFNNAGILVIAKPEMKCIINLGNSENIIQPHGHSDLLSFELFLNNIKIITDSGSYRYNGDPELRKYFRSSLAHNTLTIDNKDFAKQITKFKWLNNPKPATTIEVYQATKLYSYLKATIHSAWNYSREFLFLKATNQFIIRDLVISAGIHHICYSLHLNPQNYVKSSGELIVINESTARIKFFGTKDFDIEETLSSSRYGKIQKGMVVRIRRNAQVFNLVTVISSTALSEEWEAELTRTAELTGNSLLNFAVNVLEK